MAESKSFPPVVAQEYIVVSREPRTESFVITLPNQDSFELLPLEAESYMKMMGISEGEGLLEYVWNFYGAKFWFEGMVMEPLTFEQAEALGKPKEKVAF